MIAHIAYLQNADLSVKSKIRFADRKLRNAGMSKHQRLKLAREKHFRTAKEAAASLGVPYGTYSGHEAGSRGIKDDYLKLYARRFKVPISWLYFGMQEDDREGKYEIDVIGEVSRADGLVETFDEGKGLVAQVLLPFPSDSLAVSISDNNLWPRYSKGDLIIFADIQPEDEEIRFGAEFVVCDKQGVIYLAFVHEGKEDDTIYLKTHTSSRSREMKVSWIAEVFAIIRTGLFEVVAGKDVKVPTATQSKD